MITQVHYTPEASASEVPFGEARLVRYKGQTVIGARNRDSTTAPWSIFAGVSGFSTTNDDEVIVLARLEAV